MSPYHIEGRVVLWYFCLRVKERETLDETLMAWKKYRGNQCKLVVISKILLRF
jgi:hypothetical protein